MFREPIDEPDVPSTGLRYTPEQLKELIQHLYSLEKQYGIVITVVTRGDVEDAWENNHPIDDDLDAPPFTDEMWEKFQATWAWRKGLSEMMWDGVHDCIRDGFHDIRLSEEGGR